MIFDCVNSENYTEALALTEHNFARNEGNFSLQNKKHLNMLRDQQRIVCIKLSTDIHCNIIRLGKAADLQK